MNIAFAVVAPLVAVTGIKFNALSIYLLLFHFYIFVSTAFLTTCVDYSIQIEPQTFLILLQSFAFNYFFRFKFFLVVHL